MSLRKLQHSWKFLFEFYRSPQPCVTHDFSKGGLGSKDEILSNLLPGSENCHFFHTPHTPKEVLHQPQT